MSYATFPLMITLLQKLYISNCVPIATSLHYTYVLSESSQAVFAIATNRSTHLFSAYWDWLRSNCLVLPAHWPSILDAGSVLVSVPLLICAGFVYCHVIGKDINLFFNLNFFKSRSTHNNHGLNFGYIL